MLNFIALRRPLDGPVPRPSGTGPRMVAVSLILVSADFIYRIFWNISPQTRERCLIYAGLPRWASVVYENLAELVLLIIASVFVSLLLEKYLSRHSRLVPANPLAAFVYGALMPVCSCGILPLAARLRDRMGPAATIALLVTGPLLSPQILFLSLTVAGPVYTAARIGATLALAMTMGLFAGRMGLRLPGTAPANGCSKDCEKSDTGILSRTWDITRDILPSAVLAGLLGIVIELFRPLEHLAVSGILRSPAGVLAAALSGVPVYLCNGADILFLKPLMADGLPLGTALAFSLTSSSVCAASLILMSHLLGRKAAFYYLASIMAGTLVIGILLNHIHP